MQIGPFLSVFHNGSMADARDSSISAVETSSIVERVNNIDSPLRVDAENCERFIAVILQLWQAARKQKIFGLS